MNSSRQKLAGKVALVTGASKGIGASIAKHLAAEGAAVAVNYSSSKAGADAVVAEITAGGGRAVAIQGSVAVKADAARIVAEANNALGPVDILVNNAGVYEFAPLEEVTEESFDRQFGVNVLGLLFVTQEAVRAFNPAGGSIINIGSVAGKIGMPGAAVYGATKASVDVITKTLAKELGPKGIRVNAINPGMVETEGVHAAGIAESDFRRQIEAQTPLGRIGQPQDIAGAAVFLASPDSSWISGETIYIAGGYPV
jgi:3-oxoacyl-[acyl-carrier protein] reductase